MEVPVPGTRLAQNDRKTTAIIPGSAESVFAYVSGGRGLSCAHFPKYRAGESTSQQSYPSRLGFFHLMSTDGYISYLDTKKLCAQCVDEVVPSGYNYWSMWWSSGSQGGSHHLGSRWLDAPPSENSYPPLFQAGTEDFDQALPYVANGPSPHPVTVPIPQVPDAHESWVWLRDQRKPFYIDQLHLAKGWSSYAQQTAEADATIAAASGHPFPTAQRDRSIEIGFDFPAGDIRLGPDGIVSKPLVSPRPGFTASARPVGIATNLSSSPATAPQTNPPYSVKRKPIPPRNKSAGQVPSKGETPCNRDTPGSSLAPIRVITRPPPLQLPPVAAITQNALDQTAAPVDKTRPHFQSPKGPSIATGSIDNSVCKQIIRPEAPKKNRLLEEVGPGLIQPRSSVPVASSPGLTDGNLNSVLRQAPSNNQLELTRAPGLPEGTWPSKTEPLPTAAIAEPATHTKRAQEPARAKKTRAEKDIRKPVDLSNSATSSHGQASLPMPQTSNHTRSWYRHDPILPDGLTQLPSLAQHVRTPTQSKPEKFSGSGPSFVELIGGVSSIVRDPTGKSSRATGGLDLVSLLRQQPGTKTPASEFPDSDISQLMKSRILGELKNYPIIQSAQNYALFDGDALKSQQRDEPTKRAGKQVEKRPGNLSAKTKERPPLIHRDLESSPVPGKSLQIGRSLESERRTSVAREAHGQRMPNKENLAAKSRAISREQGGMPLQVPARIEPTSKEERQKRSSSSATPVTKSPDKGATRPPAGDAKPPIHAVDRQNAGMKPPAIGKQPYDGTGPKKKPRAPVPPRKPDQLRGPKAPSRIDTTRPRPPAKRHPVSSNSNLSIPRPNPSHPIRPHRQGQKPSPKTASGGHGHHHPSHPASAGHQGKPHPLGPHSSGSPTKPEQHMSTFPHVIEHHYLHDNASGEDNLHLSILTSNEAEHAPATWPISGEGTSGTDTDETNSPTGEPRPPEHPSEPAHPGEDPSEGNPPGSGQVSAYPGDDASNPNTPIAPAQPGHLDGDPSQPNSVDNSTSNTQDFNIPPTQTLQSPTQPEKPATDAQQAIPAYLSPEDPIPLQSGGDVLSSVPLYTPSNGTAPANNQLEHKARLSVSSNELDDHSTLPIGKIDKTQKESQTSAPDGGKTGPDSGNRAALPFLATDQEEPDKKEPIDPQASLQGDSCTGQSSMVPAENTRTGVFDATNEQRFQLRGEPFADLSNSPSRPNPNLSQPLEGHNSVPHTDEHQTSSPYVPQQSSRTVDMTDTGSRGVGLGFVGAAVGAAATYYAVQHSPISDHSLDKSLHDLGTSDQEYPTESANEDIGLPYGGNPGSSHADNGIAPDAYNYEGISDVEPGQADGYIWRSEKPLGINVYSTTENHEATEPHYNVGMGQGFDYSEQHSRQDSDDDDRPLVNGEDGDESVYSRLRGVLEWESDCTDAVHEDIDDVSRQIGAVASDEDDSGDGSEDGHEQYGDGWADEISDNDVGDDDISVDDNDGDSGRDECDSDEDDDGDTNGGDEMDQDDDRRSSDSDNDSSNEDASYEEEDEVVRGYDHEVNYDDYDDDSGDDSIYERDPGVVYGIDENEAVSEGGDYNDDTGGDDTDSGEEDDSTGDEEDEYEISNGVVEEAYGEGYYQEESAGYEGGGYDYGDGGDYEGDDYENDDYGGDDYEDEY